MSFIHHIDPPATALFATLLVCVIVRLSARTPSWPQQHQARAAELLLTSGLLQANRPTER